MAKTQEELTALKEEYNTLTTKLNELSDDELGYVTGGTYSDIGTDFDLFTEAGVAVTMDGHYIRVADGLRYTCSSYNNYSDHTRYFFIRVDGKKNTLFSIDAYVNGQITTEIYVG